jgi:hypothetical protein
LKGVPILPIASHSLGFGASAQTNSAAAGATEVPPILFVHGNGDHAALWITTLWRMESNGVPRDRMLAINFADLLARTDDAVPQPNRSSTADQCRELGEAISELKRRTGMSPVALVDSISTLRLPDAGRPVIALFNQERIVARAWPASENRMAVAELTY